MVNSEVITQAEQPPAESARGQALPSSGKLHWLFLGVSCALLGLLLASGAVAVASLRKMHAQQSAITHVLTERTQLLSGLSLSVQSYNDAVQRFLGQAQANQAQEDQAQREQAAASRHHIEQLAVEIDSDLRRYPVDRDSAEAVLFDGMRDVYLQQRTVYVAVLESKPDQRRREAQNLIKQQMEPLQKKITDWSGKMRTWNSDRLKTVDDSLVAELAGAQSGLTKALAIGLASGLLLVLSGMAYIVRLERQTRGGYDELVQSRRELQDLSSRLVDAQETERRSISRELHDEIGQSLGALLVDLGHLSTAMADQHPEVKEQLANMKSIAERTFQSVRNIALLLRPSMLDDLGLVAALEWQAREISRRSDIEVEIQSENVSDDLPDEYRICVYRLVQEALNNAVRHSGAKNATVAVRQSPTSIVARISDDGQGFDPVRTRGLGLLGMDERVKRLSGTLSVESTPGHGATVTAELPFHSTNGRHA